MSQDKNYGFYSGNQESPKFPQGKFPAHRGDQQTFDHKSASPSVNPSRSVNLTQHSHSHPENYSQSSQRETFDQSLPKKNPYFQSNHQKFNSHDSFSRTGLNPSWNKYQNRTGAVNFKGQKLKNSHSFQSFDHQNQNQNFQDSSLNSLRTASFPTQHPSSTFRSRGSSRGRESFRDESSSSTSSHQPHSQSSTHQNYQNSFQHFSHQSQHQPQQHQRYQQHHQNQQNQPNQNFRQRAFNPTNNPRDQTLAPRDRVMKTEESDWGGENVSETVRFEGFDETLSEANHKGFSSSSTTTSLSHHHLHHSEESFESKSFPQKQDEMRLMQDEGFSKGYNSHPSAYPVAERKEESKGDEEKRKSVMEPKGSQGEINFDTLSKEVAGSLSSMNQSSVGEISDKETKMFRVDEKIRKPAAMEMNFELMMKLGWSESFERQILGLEEEVKRIRD
eukprot:Sdes_comp10867_c0_seq1m2526